MKKTCTLFALLVFTLFACTKKYNTTNNYYTTPANAQPAFIVEGLDNIILTNDLEISTEISVTVQYEDSIQQGVTLSLSGLPAGVVIDTTWVSHGIPTFTTNLSFFDTTAVGATTGIYTATLTATATSGEKKNYPFTVKILPMPTAFLGKYTNCSSSCTSGSYSDSLYVDAVTPNKIWFSNFENTGNNVYGFVSITNFNDMITIPPQTVSGIIYSGTSGNNIVLSEHEGFTLNIHAGTNTCSFSIE